MGKLLFKLVCKNYTPHIAFISPGFQYHKYTEPIMGLFGKPVEKVKASDFRDLLMYDEMSQSYMEEAIIVKINDAEEEEYMPLIVKLRKNIDMEKDLNRKLVSKTGNSTESRFLYARTFQAER